MTMVKTMGPTGHLRLKKIDNQPETETVNLQEPNGNKLYPTGVNQTIIESDDSQSKNTLQHNDRGGAVCLIDRIVVRK